MEQNRKIILDLLLNKSALKQNIADDCEQVFLSIKEAIKKEDQVSESEYERRLTVCKTCELLNAGTCGAAWRLTASSASVRYRPQAHPGDLLKIV